MAFRHFRRHWKKYGVGQLLGMGLASYLIRKHRERNVIREYCFIAKTFGEEKAAMLEKPKKIMVFLNQTANNSDAKIQFTKYAAPLLHLSGLDVTVVESEYQGHIQMLMNYVDPSTDGIVIAGGDGTVLEVLNGLLQRRDAEAVRRAVVGILPLGKENQSFKTLFPSACWTSTARSIGEATLCILQGLTSHVPVLEIKPDKGCTLFALSSVQWGVFKDAYVNRDKFWLFGKLRLFASFVSTALRGWPGESFPAQWTFQGLSNPVVASNEPLASTKLEISAFKLCSSDSSVSVTTWPVSSLSKSAFIKHGWSRIIGRSHECEIPGKEWAGQELAVSPPEKLCSDGSWVSVDGEKYEAVPMHVRLKPQHLTVYSPPSNT